MVAERTFGVLWNRRIRLVSFSQSCCAYTEVLTWLSRKLYILELAFPISSRTCWRIIILTSKSKSSSSQSFFMNRLSVYKLPANFATKSSSKKGVASNGLMTGRGLRLGDARLNEVWLKSVNIIRGICINILAVSGCFAGTLLSPSSMNKQAQLLVVTWIFQIHSQWNLAVSTALWYSIEERGLPSIYDSISDAFKSGHASWYSRRITFISARWSFPTIATSVSSVR
mmetsp:Transcript_3494/g.6725  ORF Transcript_3494/g.6725 Transcript_3494/m.6725 type:complete len:227 (+) Transcript_3494:254-934(+)